MRDIQRIDRILKLLKQIWKDPSWQDQRFGQTLINCGIVEDGNLTWNIEDDEIEQALVNIIKETKNNKRK